MIAADLINLLPLFRAMTAAELRKIAAGSEGADYAQCARAELHRRQWKGQS